jgi:hypothetical protein
VAKGKLHHENPVMFGPAFLEAYHIETTIAKYPRVVLSRETYQNFQKQRGAVVANPRILLSEDGPPHLHIFAAFEEAPQDTAVKKLCQGMIQSLLDESIFVPKHYEKLRWLAIYWNSTAARGDPVHRIVFPVAQNLEGLPRAH